MKRLELLKDEYNYLQPNQYASVMTTRTEEQLEATVNAPQGDYNPEAIQAAKQEKVRREIIKIELSELSDEKLLDFIKHKKNYATDREYAEEEAKNRNLITESDNKHKGITVVGIVIAILIIIRLLRFLFKMYM